jgi:DNA (cytosine-5)-methyltransferase 1
MDKLKVIELFAGVGGFRLGLESTAHYQVIWSNQWEPSTKTQHASTVYEARFGKQGHSNADIATIPTKQIPDADILVGGFPCQDYSVAATLHNSRGLVGKKGVLWWSIHRILSEKKQPPKYLFLENVDRLLKSPATQRGRDFAIMLKSLDELGYAVEWRVINAADYGMPQRRRRIFFLGYHKSTEMYQQLQQHTQQDWLLQNGVLAKAFSVAQTITEENNFNIKDDLVSLSKDFNKGEKLSPFLNTGVFVNGHVTTVKTKPAYDGPRTVLGDVLEKNKVPETFYIAAEEEPKWKYLKGGKKETRTAKNGYTYTYSEGSMVFPDGWDAPSRTIITGEGGTSPSRFKHVVATKNGLRRLTPVELERLNMFPDNHTQLNGISDSKRAFFMGNALVVGVVETIGRQLFRAISTHAK